MVKHITSANGVPACRPLGRAINSPVRSAEFKISWDKPPKGWNQKEPLPIIILKTIRICCVFDPLTRHPEKAAQRTDSLLRYSLAGSLFVCPEWLYIVRDIQITIVNNMDY